eukprot:4316637-Lingulodinium_polyedra.AAC.1
MQCVRYRVEARSVIAGFQEGFKVFSAGYSGVCDSLAGVAPVFNSRRYVEAHLRRSARPEAGEFQGRAFVVRAR